MERDLGIRLEEFKMGHFNPVPSLVFMDIEEGSLYLLPQHATPLVEQIYLQNGKITSFPLYDKKNGFIGRGKALAGVRVNMDELSLKYYFIGFL